MNLTSENFISTINNGVSVVDFYADWCGPCKMMAPVIDELTTELKDKAVVAKVNVDEEANIAGQYGISSIPTLIYFKNGQEVDRVLGVQSKDSIVTKVNSLL